MWYKSKTKWGGIVGALSLLMPAVSQGLSTGDWSALPEAGVQSIAVVLYVFGWRNAIDKASDRARGG